jgi:hypothetical protein
MPGHAKSPIRTHKPDRAIRSHGERKLEHSLANLPKHHLRLLMVECPCCASMRCTVAEKCSAAQTADGDPVTVRNCR